MGEGLEIRNSVITGSTLINLSRNTTVFISDKQILGKFQIQPLSQILYGWNQQLIAGFLCLFASPFLCYLIWKHGLEKKSYVR